MKNHKWLAILLASFAMAIAGCSRQSQSIAFPKIINLGAIHATDGKASRHTLPDGRVCTITPTVLPDGHVHLATTIIATKASGFDRASLDFDALPMNGGAYTFAFDRHTLLAVTLDK